MATGSSKPASPNTELDDKDLAELHKVLFPARIQYKSFGLQIGVGVDEIKMNQDSGHCLLEILTARLRMIEPLTWNDIDAALREECVGLGSTADKIRKRYPLLFTPTVIIASEHEREKQVNFEKKVIKRDVKDAHHHHHEHTVKSEYIEEQKGSDHQAMMSKERERISEYYEGMRVGQEAKGKSTESSNKETYHKTRSKPPRKETEGRDGKREVDSEMKAKEATAPPLERDLPSSEMAQTDSGDGESDESSEDENELEQQSSDEEEETENDDLSTAEDKEEKRSEKSRKSKEKATHPTTEMRKRKSQDDEIFRRVKGKKLSKAVGAPTKVDSHGDKEESDAGGSRNQEDQPKKRKRRRHRKSSKSPIVRGGSSPSSSQEERKHGSRRQRRTPNHGGKYKRKEKKKRRETSSSSSDTDSSSPESEMLTKSEKKKLRKVFKYSFGQLCSASFNPVETAVQLQKKGLISPGMMMDIIRSPESQQENIIRLVCGLDNRIRSRPGRLFGCIEVLLENDALQKVGREMLRETGKPFTHQAQGMFVMMCISSSLQV